MRAAAYGTMFYFKNTPEANALMEYDPDYSCSGLDAAECRGYSH